MFLAILKYTLIFTFMGNDPKVDYHEFLNLLLHICSFIFTVLSQLDVYMFSSASFLLANTYKSPYVLIPI